MFHETSWSAIRTITVRTKAPRTHILTLRPERKSSGASTGSTGSLAFAAGCRVFFGCALGSINRASIAKTDARRRQVYFTTFASAMMTG